MKITINDSITLEIKTDEMQPLFANLVGSDPAKGDPKPPSIPNEGLWIDVKTEDLWEAYSKGRPVRVVMSGPDFTETQIHEVVYALAPKVVRDHAHWLFGLGDPDHCILYCSESLDEYPKYFEPESPKD